MKSDHRTEDRYKWRFDEIPASFLSTKYYDEVEYLAFTGGSPGQLAQLVFPPIDARSIITHWGISFGTDLLGAGVFEENIFQIQDAVSITLKINNSAVPGYSGLDFPPCSWMHYNTAGTENYTCMVLTPAFLIPLTYPIFEMNTPLEIDIIDVSLPLQDFQAYGRIMGRYID